jgi:nitrate/nitrite transporter NarK
MLVLALLCGFGGGNFASAWPTSLSCPAQGTASA